jgi:lysophospholipid acyltransferase (LPLAT)-like uncharacterized protein
MRTAPAQPSPAQRGAARAGALLLRALFLTLRLRVRDEGNFLADPPPHPVIYAFWHNRILAITAAFLRVYPARRRGVLVLTSASRDGMWLGELAARLGMGSVRGSSSRRGAAALRELLGCVAAGHDIAITPDGPRGPQYELDPGLVYLAQKAGIPVVPCHARFHGAWRLKTWDRFVIPAPFSRLEVTLGAPLRVPATAGADDFESERRKIESVLRARAD